MLKKVFQVVAVDDDGIAHKTWVDTTVTLVDLDTLVPFEGVAWFSCRTFSDCLTPLMRYPLRVTVVCRDVDCMACIAREACA